MQAMRDGRSVVVTYDEEGGLVIEPYKGISKAKVGKKELKGVRRRKPKAPAKVIKRAERVVERLIEGKVPFRIIVGRGEVEIRFSLDQYVKLTKEDEAKIVGFSSADEHPISLFRDELTGLRVVFLKPL